MFIFTIKTMLILSYLSTALFAILTIVLYLNYNALYKKLKALEQIANESFSKETLLNYKNNELTTKTNLLLNEIAELNLKNTDLLNENLDFRTENNVLKEKLVFQKTETSYLHQQTTLQFESIAQKLLEEKSERFTKTNQENIDNLLKPLNENIERFKKQVEDTYDKESKLRFSLNERIQELMMQTNKISSEANNLANALKTNYKKQGDWGEVILENILQHSGLVKNREYRLQNNLITVDGKNVRPDVIIDLPDQKSIVVDSKVSLNAYDAFNSTTNKDEQTMHLKNHLKAIRSHIDDLSSKNYHNLVNGLDFTMLFIPIEPAYLIAVQNDEHLWQDAYKKCIILVSPTNFIACLKLITDLWNRDKQDKSAQKIVQQAQKIYEKTVLFTKTFEQVGKQLTQAQDAYLKAQNQLKEGRGNILAQTNHLLKYGISPKNVLNDFNDEEDSEFIE